MQLMSTTFTTDDEAVTHVTATVSYPVVGAFGTSTEQNSFELIPAEVATITPDRSDASVRAAVNTHLAAMGATGTV